MTSDGADKMIKKLYDSLVSLSFAESFEKTNIHKIIRAVVTFFRRLLLGRLRRLVLLSAAPRRQVSVFLVAHLFVEDLATVLDVLAVVVDDPVVVAAIRNDRAVFVHVNFIVHGLKIKCFIKFSINIKRASTLNEDRKIALMC